MRHPLALPACTASPDDLPEPQPRAADVLRHGPGAERRSRDEAVEVRVAGGGEEGAEVGLGDVAVCGDGVQADGDGGEGEPHGDEVRDGQPEGLVAPDHDVQGRLAGAAGGQLAILQGVGQEGEVDVVEARLDGADDVVLHGEAVARVDEEGLRDVRLGDDVRVLAVLADVAGEEVAVEEPGAVETTVIGGARGMWLERVDFSAMGIAKDLRVFLVDVHIGGHKLAWWEQQLIRHDGGLIDRHLALQEAQVVGIGGVVEVAFHDVGN